MGYPSRSVGAVTTVRRVVVVVLDDLAGPLVLVVEAFDPDVDAVDAGFLAVVLVVLLATVAAPARKVVVVVGFAPLGSGTVQVRREEPS